MRRWANETLPRQPRLALVANDAIGNFVIATSLAQMLRAAHPGCSIDLWSGSRVREFLGLPDQPGHARLFDDFHQFLRETPGTVADTAAQARRGRTYDLIVNIEDSEPARQLTALLASQHTWVCGPAACADGSTLAFADDELGRLWQHTTWVSATIREEFPFLHSGYIGEFFCRLAYLSGPLPPARVPTAPWPHAVPDVLIAMSASLPDKLWPAKAWSAVLADLRDASLTVGLLGAKPSSQSAHWLGSDAESDVVSAGLADDLRGKPSLPQVADLLSRARLVLTLDNGIMHLAATSRTPTVALFRHGIHRLWTPPWGDVRAVVAEPGTPVSAISVGSVGDAVRAALQLSGSA